MQTVQRKETHFISFKSLIKDLIFVLIKTTISRDIYGGCKNLSPIKKLSPASRWQSGILLLQILTFPLVSNPQTSACWCNFEAEFIVRHLQTISSPWTWKAPTETQSLRLRVTSDNVHRKRKPITCSLHESHISIFLPWCSMIQFPLQVIWSASSLSPQNSRDVPFMEVKVKKVFPSLSLGH